MHTIYILNVTLIENDDMRIVLITINRFNTRFLSESTSINLALAGSIPNIIIIVHCLYIEIIISRDCENVSEKSN